MNCHFKHCYKLSWLYLLWCLYQPCVGYSTILFTIECICEAVKSCNVILSEQIHCWCSGWLLMNGTRKVNGHLPRLFFLFLLIAGPLLLQTEVLVMLISCQQMTLPDKVINSVHKQVLQRYLFQSVIRSVIIYPQCCTWNVISGGLDLCYTKLSIIIAAFILMRISAEQELQVKYVHSHLSVEQER